MFWRENLPNTPDIFPNCVTSKEKIDKEGRFDENPLG